MQQDELQLIPGVGEKIARELRKIGITKVSDLKRRNPERMYLRLMEKAGGPIDRCVLYVFRCAVFYAKNPDCKNRAQLQWWNWKD